MNEKESRGISFDMIIPDLESSTDIRAKYVLESLRELTSGDYVSTVLPNTPNKLGLIKMMRIVRRTESNNQLLSIISHNGSRKVTRKLLAPRGIPKEQEFLALNTLKHRGLNTIASMAIREGSIPGERILEIRFPRVFMNLDPDIPPSQKNTLGATVAAYFLKKGPIK